MTTPGALADLLPARALGALDGEDLTALERLLASPQNAALAAQAESWTREIEALALVATPVVPLDITRARLLQGVARAEAQRALAPTPADRSGAPARSQTTPWALRAVAVALFAVLVWGTVDRSALRRDLASLRSNDQQLAAQLADVHRRLES